ncbi:MAG: protein kinase [Gemmataceae bacterium]|nr:protein kinase [Gemmataceae bacterium]MCI0743399.1 protein kinase [Gemmataceae bacterium]
MNSLPDDASAPVPDDQRTLLDAPAKQPQRTGLELRTAAENAQASEIGVVPLSRIAEYEVLSEIGRGGMGVVLKARHVRLQRVVALKMIISGTLASPDDLARFETEASAAAQLHHPGIVSLFETGAFENQRFFSMEYVSGSSLAKKVAQGPLTSRRAAEYLEAVARAVHFAHSRGILHRDLKPANILLDENEQPKVTDFGLAKMMATDSGQTRTGAVLGTPSYMSPEQAAGSKDIGPGGDIYSLGAILYELLTGRPPFRGESPLATLKQVTEQEPLPVRLLNPDVDRDLETICLKCLEKNPARRYQSAAALADDLRRFLHGEPISARRVGPVGRMVKWCMRKPAAAMLIFVSVTALVGFLVLSWRTAQEEYQLRKSAELANKLAKVQEEALRHLLYLAHIRRAQEVLQTADWNRADQLLWKAGTLTAEQTRVRGWEWFFLQERMRGRFTLSAHRDRATAVAYRPDGKRLATGGGEPTKPGEIKLWDPATGTLLATLKGHSNSINALAFSLDGKFLASASSDKTVRVWDGESGKELATLAGHTSFVAAVSFAPDSQRLVSVGGDGTLRLWDIRPVELGQEVVAKVWKLSVRALNAVAYSPKRDQIAAAGADGVVRILNLRTGKEERELKGHQGEVLAVTFDASGELLASGGGIGDRRGEVYFWEVGTGKTKFVRYGLSDRILSLSFSKSGKLAAAGSDGYLHLWDNALSSEARVFRGDPQIVYAVAFSPNGRQLAWAGRGGRVSIGNTSGGLESLHLPAAGALETIAFHHGNKFLAMGGGTRQKPTPIQVWNLDYPDTAIPLSGHGGAVKALSFGGDLLAAACDDDNIYVYDLQAPDAQPIKLEGHSAPVRALAFQPGSQLLASGGEDESVRLWNLKTKTLERILTPGHKNYVLALAFSTDGKRLASGAMDKLIRVWDLESGKDYELTGHTGSVNAVAFSPDGAQLASGSSDKTIRMWDVPPSERRETVLEGSASSVAALAFHPVGRRLATASHDRTLRLWDIVTGQEILELEDATGSFRAVGFSGDGRYLAAAAPGAALVWDAGSAFTSK